MFIELNNVSKDTQSDIVYQSNFENRFKSLYRYFSNDKKETKQKGKFGKC